MSWLPALGSFMRDLVLEKPEDALKNLMASKDEDAGAEPLTVEVVEESVEVHETQRHDDSVGCGVVSGPYECIGHRAGECILTRKKEAT